jgi:acyl-CoA dehydrogenase
MNSNVDQYQDIRDAIRDLCKQFPDEYFRKVDEARGYPEAFVNALTQAGWMAALIPQEYGGSGLGLTEASVIMEEINRSGGNSGACHGQLYNMGTLLRHGSAEQKNFYLPKYRKTTQLISCIYVFHLFDDLYFIKDTRSLIYNAR